MTLVDRVVVDEVVSRDGLRVVTTLSLPGGRLQVVVKDQFGSFTREFRSAELALDFVDRQVSAK